jgi:cytochrome P450
MLVYWQILYILSTPGLVDRLQAEIAPYAAISKPLSVGNISEAPRLTLSYQGLSEKCPLLKATYFEALRLTDQPWSIRKVSQDVVIPGNKKSADPTSFLLHKGEYVTMPHDLHMRDPKYFEEPEKFQPERFLAHSEDGTFKTDMGTMRPYGGGSSMCKGRVLAERECLSFVAGVLAFWDIEPVDKKAGWVIPGQQKTGAVSRPMHDTRARIKRRRFEWEDKEN